MMTALVVVDRARPDAKVRVTKEALAYKGSGVGLLPKGKRIKLETMLNGLLLPSGNDAAIALAQRVSGTVAGIRRADERACRRPRADLHALLVARRLRRRRQPFLRRRPRRDGARGARQAAAGADRPAPPRGRCPSRSRAAGSVLFNNNPLLRTGYPGTIGIKTGFTDAAGRCLVAAARRNGRRLGVVLLHSPDPGKQATQLLNRGLRRAGLEPVAERRFRVVASIGSSRGAHGRGGLSCAAPPPASGGRLRGRGRRLSHLDRLAA